MTTADRRLLGSSSSRLRRFWIVWWFVSVAALYLLRMIQRRTKLLWQRRRQILGNAISKCPKLKNGYSPTPWLMIDRYGTLMTIITHTMQRLHNFLAPLPISYRRELLTVKDGGTIALDWAETDGNEGGGGGRGGGGNRSDDDSVVVTKGRPTIDDDAKNTSSSSSSSSSSYNTKLRGQGTSCSIEQTAVAAKPPVVIVMHGLCGCSESPYIVPLVKKIQDKGWGAVVMVARGCGGVKLTSPGTFTAARTQDFAEAVAHVRKSRPGSPVFAVGFSLGAGLLAKYLGETGNRSGITGGTCVSISWDFLKQTPMFPLWSKHFLVHSLKRYVRANHTELKLHSSPNVYLDKVLESQDVREFDHHAVVPQHGYRDVDDYYTDASAIRVCNKICTPTLAIISDDDPVCSSEGTPTDEKQLGPGVVIVRTSYGGHVAYGQNWVPSRESWAHDVALEWFEALKSSAPGGSGS